MQAEHIPVHLGSMPDAVAAVLDEEQRPGEAWILNDPYRGGTHLPDITLISPVFAAGELLGFAACRAHHADVGGPTPGGHAGPLAHARRGGRGDPADPRRRGGARAAGRADARAAPAPRRPARPGRRQPDRRAAARRAGRAPRARGAARRDGARSSPTPSAAPGPRSRRCPTALRRRGRARGRRRGARDVELRVAATIDGDRLDARLRRHRPAGRRQPQLPALGDQVGGLLRGAGRSPTPTRRPRPAPTGRSRCCAPEGCLLNARFPAAVAAGNVETSSRVADLVIAALAGARPVPAQGQGTMNNLTLAERGLHLLRDARRRPGRLPRRGRAERDPRGDVEHAQHAGRGAGDRVPAAGPRAGGAARQRRRGRHRGGDGIVREIEALAPMRFTLITERRRHARAAATAAATARPAATCSTASRCPARRRGTWRPGTGSGSRPRRRRVG